MLTFVSQNFVRSGFFFPTLFGGQLRHCGVHVKGYTYCPMFKFIIAKLNSIVKHYEVLDSFLAFFGLLGAPGGLVTKK